MSEIVGAPVPPRIRLLEMVMSEEDTAWICGTDAALVCAVRRLSSVM
jgi:hypothetical protein